MSISAPVLQQQLVLNSQVLQGLYEEYSNLRKSRKHYNDVADKLANDSLYQEEWEERDKAQALSDESKANRQQAALYTPYIRKFKAKIAKISKIQKMLKAELKGQQEGFVANLIEDEL